MRRISPKTLSTIILQEYYQAGHFACHNPLSFTRICSTASDPIYRFGWFACRGLRRPQSFDHSGTIRTCLRLPMVRSWEYLLGYVQYLSPNFSGHEATLLTPTLQISDKRCHPPLSLLPEPYSQGSALRQRLWRWYRRWQYWRTSQYEYMLLFLNYIPLPFLKPPHTNSLTQGVARIFFPAL